jgi:hypothetical protein
MAMAGSRRYYFSTDLWPECLVGKRVSVIVGGRSGRVVKRSK